MEFLIWLLAFISTYTDVTATETTSTWFTIEEKIESDRLIDEELQENLEFLNTLLK